MKTPNKMVPDTPRRHRFHRPGQRHAALKTAKLELTTSLFNGGALDSQVTDSQYIRELTGETQILPEGRAIDLEEQWTHQNPVMNTSPDEKDVVTCDDKNCVVLAESPGRDRESKPSDEDLQLSDIEKDVILLMRKACNLEVQGLVDKICKLSWSKDDLHSEYQSLRIWNQDLVAALEEHDIFVPSAPSSQFAGL